MSSLRFLFPRSARNNRLTAWSSVVLMVLSILLLVVTLVLRNRPENYDRSARRLAKSVEERMALLDLSMRSMLASGTPGEDFAEDMVLYSYRNDTLVDWRNQFPLFNDAIQEGEPISFPSARLRRTPSQPLSGVSEQPTFTNFGPKWYIVRSMSEGRRTVVGGLLVKDLLQSGDGGISPLLYSGGSFTLEPLDYGSGYEISVGGTPVLTMVPSSETGPRSPLTWPLWLALALNVIGSVLYLAGKRNLRRFLLLFIGHSIILLLIWTLCRDVRDSMQLFSPVTYAGGKVFYSLGILLVIHIYILLAAMLAYMLRRPLFRWSIRRHAAFRTSLMGILSLGAIVLLCVHIHRSFTDILINSGIFLELPKFQTLSILSGLVYGSFLTLVLAIPLLAQFLRPAMRYFFRLQADSLRRIPRIIFAILAGSYFVIAASVVGREKEQMMVGTWAGRLVMDRDISLEPRLLRVEDNIRRDAMLDELVYGQGDNSEAITQRLRDYLLRALTQNYDIAVFRINSYEPMNPAVARILELWVGEGEAITSTSSFLFSTDGRGRARYAGVFTYPSDTQGDTRLIVCIESKGNRDDRGYLSLLGIPSQGAVALPPIFSYARYRYGELVTQGGSMTYPTLLPERYAGKTEEGGNFLDVRDGNTYFINCVSPDDTVIISRKKVALSNYLFAHFLLALLLSTLLAFIRPVRRRNPGLEQNYFNSRIQTVLYTSLVLFVFVVAGFSAYFVGTRSRNDAISRMTERIGKIRDQLQDRMRYYPSLSEVAPADLAESLETVSDATGSDLTLYSPDGKMLRSTAPDLYRQMLLGTRVNDKAFHAIRDEHEPSCIVGEKIRGRAFNAVYGPVFNAAGEQIGFVSVPFVSSQSRLPSDSVNYLISILSIFLLLLLIVRYFLRRFLDRMFTPIVELGDKMARTDINHLEPLVYERDDEISTLVAAYNRMVEVMSDSTRKLAQAERDRAWSEMARQVAHEIKNPLTPIKLRLQMLIRMKESGNPAWTEKFDEVAGVVLEHIDILADTASQFSTFAKLYSEDPVEFDLDNMIQEEISMFDAREDVRFSYFGLEGTRIIGPKPQLTRVLVNLLTNAIQAVEGQENGQVLVSLRLSGRDGFYDIVVEDNGPGVKQEHQDKLFTPNFTTKNRGTGLGLAICRNIVERCGGTIAYSRSFVLGGACFTVQYPKK